MEQSTETVERQWAARVDGEVLFAVAGPDAEALARGAAGVHGTAIFRDYEPPSADYPASHWGPWVDA